ncbi:hypothetical protein IB229_01530 [Pseudomonas sp. PDM14]|uniref:hypothetical protein n=1 Tax=Pseudomonas sp. PDM14 TaxID=2769288 RepID=UPI001780C268|nr:hypothetical protein [Pseudomonas sp. PDM14]MBD9481638.1 hypothetical protein [Pseudomonas sp. PDM14]
MKKIIKITLLASVIIYATYLVSSKNMLDHGTSCLTSSGLHEKFKNIKTKEEAKIVEAELELCVDNKKTFIQSLFFSKKYVSDKFNIDFE